MVIVKTPFRISFVGGGTDFKDFYREHGGAVLSTTFDKFCYVTVRSLPHFFEYKTEVCYSEIERVQHTSELQHPLIREAMNLLNVHDIRLTYEADLPARSGLGTSSAFAVGMLNALHFLKGQRKSKLALAEEAIYLERVLCREAGGIQDQIATAAGGMNKITFHAEGYEVTPVQISPARKKRLNDSLMLFFTGFSRYSFEIQAQTHSRLKQNVPMLLELKALVSEAEAILLDEAGDLNAFGRLLDEDWRLKRGLNKGISTAVIDSIYERAKQAGALGGKLLGAGGGGFILFYAEPEQQEAVKAALRELLYVPFQFEEAGTDVIYHDEACELQEAGEQEALTGAR